MTGKGIKLGLPHINETNFGMCPCQQPTKATRAACRVALVRESAIKTLIRHRSRRSTRPDLPWHAGRISPRPMTTRPRSQPGPPMTVGTARQRRASLDVCCWLCHHRRFLSADPCGLRTSAIVRPPHGVHPLRNHRAMPGRMAGATRPLRALVPAMAMCASGIGQPMRSTSCRKGWRRRRPRPCIAGKRPIDVVGCGTPMPDGWLGFGAASPHDSNGHHPPK